jgi:DNA-binding CsgD family transcriptional regulator
MRRAERSVELVIANSSLLRRVTDLVAELGLPVGWRVGSPAATGFAKSQADVLVAAELDAGALRRLAEGCAVERGILLLACQEGLSSQIEELFGRGLGAAQLDSDFSDEEFLAVLPAVAQGFVLRHSPAGQGDSPDEAPRLSGAESSGSAPLKLREAEVITLLAEGASNREIAAELGISENTVKFHLQSLYGKLGVSSRAGAVFAAMKRGELRI